MQAAGDLHHAIRNAISRETQNIFDNPATFNACESMFDHYTRRREDPIEHLLTDTQLFALRLFLGCVVMTPSGS